MPGDTPKEAVEQFLQPLRRVLACVTSGFLNVRGGYYPSETPHTAFIGQGLPVPLAGLGRLKLRFAHQYRVVETPGERGPWKVRTAGYYYSLDDADDHEIIAYHWHPEGESPVTFPHLHIGAGAGCQRSEMQWAHCPTGRIAVEEFLRFAIECFQVEAEPRWETVFAEAQRDFERWRSWP